MLAKGKGRARSKRLLSLNKVLLYRWNLCSFGDKLFFVYMVKRKGFGVLRL